jgi:integrase
MASRAAGKVEGGALLRSISKGGKVGDSLGEWAIWALVTEAAKEFGIERFGAHHLRCTCSELCRKAGGHLEQIKFLLGHSLDPDNGALPWLGAGNHSCGE